MNIISLMVSILLGGLIAMGLSSMYADLVRSKLFGADKQLMTLRYGTALNQLTMDIMQSGNFGCFSSRMLGNSRYAQIHTFATDSILKYNTEYAGLYAFTSNNIPNIDSNVFNGVNLLADSDIVKLQYGSGQAIVPEFTINGSNFNTLSFQMPRYTNVTTSNIINSYTSDVYRQAIITSTNIDAPYVLSSCSRLDQIQGATNNNNEISIASYNIPASGNYAHDLSSLMLMNFVTKYYYVATENGITGLYTKNLQPDGSLSSSTLLSVGVTNISYNFEVESGMNRQIKATSAMIDQTDWANISNVVVNLTIQTSESVGLANAPAVQNLQQSVKVRP